MGIISEGYEITYTIIVVYSCTMIWKVVISQTYDISDIISKNYDIMLSYLLTFQMKPNNACHVENPSLNNWKDVTLAQNCLNWNQ